ncbi:hypothetical protein Tco_1445585 [Tanacetum coccineum]
MEPSFQVVFCNGIINIKIKVALECHRLQHQREDAKSARRDVVRQQNVEKSTYAKELEATTTFELKALTEEVMKLMNHSETQFILLELEENGHT